MNIVDILHELQVFDNAGLPWIFMILMAIGFIVYIFKNTNFRNATEKMKEMSNDNVHILAEQVSTKIEERFKSIESLIQTEVIFGNRNLISGLRDEIKVGLQDVKGEVKIGLNGLGKQKYEMEQATRNMNKASRMFLRICSNCQYKDKK